MRFSAPINQLFTMIMGALGDTISVLGLKTGLGPHDP
jgi:hypothetical protein